MKAIKYLAFVSLIVLGVTACRKDLLETTPYNAISSNSIWTSSNLATLAVNGIYNTMLENSGEEYQNSVSQGNYFGLDAHTMSALDIR